MLAPNRDSADDFGASAVALLIPCRNEATTVAKVIEDFRRELPAATIFVIDNGSTDDTARIARQHGARVLRECRQGKGFAIENMFDHIEADAYVLVDGDDTYPAESVHDLLRPVIAGDADMCVGARLGDFAEGSFRPLHLFGNKLVVRLANWVRNASLTDVMSGYRAFGRRVVERVPVVSGGFEVETELTLQTLYYQLKIVEIPVRYRERPPGSTSKLRTVRDGARILWRLFSLFRAFKPLTFFGGGGIVLLALAVAAGIPPVRDYVVRPDHYVAHVPLAILAVGLVILSAMSTLLGVLLHAINWRFLELHGVLVRRGDLVVKSPPRPSKSTTGGRDASP